MYASSEHPYLKSLQKVDFFLYIVRKLKKIAFINLGMQSYSLLMSHMFNVYMNIDIYKKLILWGISVIVSF